MSIPRLLLCLPIVWLCKSVLADEPDLNFGRAPGEAELASFTPHIFADGRGLPSGSGNPEQGKLIYDQHCAKCHGSEGQGGAALELVGDRKLLATEYPDRGIAVYWPYAPPLFDYIRRAMPPDKPYSLSDNETYAVIARLLELNGLIGAGQNVDAALLSSLQMPNRDNFRSLYSTAE